MNLKCLACIIPLFCIASLSRAQAPAIEWAECLGDVLDDWAECVQLTNDGGYVVAGWTEGVFNGTLPSHGGYDYCITKLNSAGGLQWQKFLGGSGLDQARTIAVTSDGGYVVAGNASYSDGDVTGIHGSATDIWVVKLDTGGTIEWQKSLGGTGDEFASRVLQTADGGYIVSGSTASSDGDVTGHNGGTDVWVAKLDATGTLEWQRCLGGSGEEEKAGIALASDGGYILCGTTASTDGDVIGNHGNKDVWLVKLSDAGTIEWQKCFGGYDYDFGMQIGSTTDGGYIVAAHTYSNDGDVNGHWGYDDYWILKLDVTGELTWQKCLGGLGLDYAMAVEQTSDGGYVVGGASDSVTGDVSGGHGGMDHWVVKLDGTGALQWQKCLGGPGDDWAYSVQETTDEGFIVVGGVNSTTGDVFGNHGAYDWWVVKLTGSGLVVRGTETNDVRIYPNPASEQITVEGRRSFAGQQFVLTDAAGRSVRTGILHGWPTVITIDDLPTGAYSLSLSIDRPRSFHFEKK